VQLNGAKGVHFSDIPVEGDMESYASSFRKASQGLLEMGVTSFLPTLVSSEAQAIQRVSCNAHPSTARHLHNASLEI
jgi:N-acetylglucosamine-6-phosphate deacetylase